MTVKSDDSNKKSNAPDSRSLVTSIPSLDFSIPNLFSSLSVPNIDFSKLYVPDTSLLVHSMEIVDQTNELLKFLGPTIELLNDTMEQLKKITAPEIITDSEFKKRQNRSKKYGSMMWTHNPNEVSPIYELDDEQFEKKVKKWEKGDDFDETIDFIKSRHSRRIVLDELDEAVGCFRHKEYRACAGILLSIIDGEICRFIKQKSNCNNLVSSENRKKVFNNISNTDVTTLHEWVGIKAAYDELYKGTEFRNRSIPVNRNSVQHGMNTKRVTKRYCVQLSFFLWNFIEFANNIRNDNGKMVLLRLKSIEIMKTPGV